MADALASLASGGSSSSTATTLAAFTFASGTAIGATTVTLNATPGATAVKVGDYVACGAGTTSCEIRRVTGVSGAVLTLGSALKVAHSTGDNVWVTAGYWVPFEWFGAIANSAVDSYRALINAFLDQAQSTADYGLSGRGVSGIYGSSRPLFQQDYCGLRDVTLQAFSTFALDCTVGKDTTVTPNIPNQYFFTLAGQFGTVTFDAAADTITTSVNPGATQYSDVIFYPRPGSTMPSGIEEGRRYFTITGNNLTTQITKSQGDATPVDITSAGSGEIVMVSTGLARMKWKEVRLHGNNTKALNGLVATVQQPSIADSSRIESFPVIGVSVAAQQATFPNIEIIHCWTGLELAGAEMVYFPQGNIEGCDINVSCPELARMYGGTDTFSSSFKDFHFESAGFGPSQIQTLTHATNLTAGTFQFRFKNVLTGAINWNASAAAIQTALEAHAGIGVGNVTVTLLSGTNLSDGVVQMDFTVGTLRWEFWSGSTNTAVGGEMAIVSSLTGGPLVNNFLSPLGKHVSFKRGQAVQFDDCYVAFPGAVNGLTPPFIKCEGTAIDSSQGVFQGFSITDAFTGADTGTWVDDSLNGITLLTADGATGTGHYLASYVRPTRHGAGHGQHWWYVGDGGRRVKLNTAGKPQIEVIASSAQTEDLEAFTGTDGTVGVRVNNHGYVIVRRTTTPADADLVAGECAFWFDSTNGAAKLMVKGKQADGTVKTGSFNVQT